MAAGSPAATRAGSPSADLANTFAKLGYVSFSINYRLLSSGCGGGSNPNTPSCTAAALAAISDAQGAVRWVREHAAQYGIDPTRIGIGGESAGAITSAGVGMFAENGNAEGNPSVSDRVGGFFSISGGLPQGLFASADDAPGVLVHGTNDSVVPYQWSVDTAVALLKQGVAAFLEPLDGQGHVPYFEPYKSQIVSQADYFFYFVLDLGHAQGQSAATRQAFDRQRAALDQAAPDAGQALPPERALGVPVASGSAACAPPGPPAASAAPGGAIEQPPVAGDARGDPGGTQGPPEQGLVGREHRQAERRLQRLDGADGAEAVAADEDAPGRRPGRARRPSRAGPPGSRRAGRWAARTPRRRPRRSPGRGSRPRPGR